MSAVRGPIVALAATICLALPGAAVAQSAGDDQYADPFEPKPKQEQSQSNAPAPADQGSPGSGAGAPVTRTAAPAPPAGSDAQLPYTGLNSILLIVTGAVLLLAGLTVRRVLGIPVAGTASRPGTYASPR